MVASSLFDPLSIIATGLHRVISAVAVSGGPHRESATESRDWAARRLPWVISRCRSRPRHPWCRQAPLAFGAAPASSSAGGTLCVPMGQLPVCVMPSLRSTRRSIAGECRFERAADRGLESRLPAEIVPLPLVPSCCRALHVGSRRSHCAAIGALNREYAGLHNLGPVPAERAGFQYRDDRLLLHTLRSMCAPAHNMSHSDIRGQERGWRGGGIAGNVRQAFYPRADKFR